MMKGDYMEFQVLEELFKRIQEITTVQDIGYHRIEEGRLKPFYKTQTDVLGIERWKTVHGQNPVYVNDTFILREIVSKKQPVEIFDTKSDTRSADAFFLFGIDSIMIVPVVREEEVKAIICIASIEKKHQFTQDEMESCAKLADEYLKNQY